MSKPKVIFLGVKSEIEMILAGFVAQFGGEVVRGEEDPSIDHLTAVFEKYDPDLIIVGGDRNLAEAAWAVATQHFCGFHCRLPNRDIEVWIIDLSRSEDEMRGWRTRAKAVIGYRWADPDLIYHHVRNAMERHGFERCMVVQPTA